MDYVIKGVFLVWGERRFRRYFLRPFWASLALFLAISVTLRLTLPRVLETAWHDLGGSPLPTWLWWIVVTIILFFVSGTIFFALNGILSSLLWEELSYQAELAAFGNAPREKTTFARGLADSAARLPSTIGWTVLGMALSLTPMGLGAAWPNGQLSLTDFTAPAYARRKCYYPAQKVRANRLRSARSFAWTAGFVSLIPILNLICLPGLIAGATLMVRQEEGAAP